MEKNLSALPEGWPTSLNYPEIPVYDFLDQTAARNPNRISIIFAGMELTYGELKELVERFANALVALGVKKGDRVAVHLPNCPQFAIAYYALLKAGAVFSPLSPLLLPNEIQHQLNDSGAETLISLDLLFPGIRDVMPQTQIKRVITTSLADCYNSINAPIKILTKSEVPDTLDMASLLKKHKPLEAKVPIDVHNDLAHIAYTGGTTGVSKGVMLTHQMVTTSVFQFSCWLSGARIEMIDGVLNFEHPPGIDPIKDRPLALDNETALVVVPWFHAMGAIAYLNGMVLAGGTMVVFPNFDAREYLEGARKYRASVLGGAPQLFIPLVNLPDFDNYDLSGIRVIGSGAAPLAGPILEKLLDSISGVVIEAYGMTECGLAATINPPDRDKIRLASVGIPVFDTECKIVDIATGEDLPLNSEGEICIKGPQVMLGYWKRPEETANVLKEGWLHTGDIGKIDEDGFLFITDRIKDMIIYKGYNVYPREIEEVIFTHPAVQQCAVIGKPDSKGGEIPIAFVELKAGLQIDKNELIEYTNSRIAHYKKIRDLNFIDTIPANETGKVLKRELRKLFQ